MTYVDALLPFEVEPVELAILSTYQFDPEFFERRLLRTPALWGARRIIVFVDASAWAELRGSNVAVRVINRRYLVVPVRHHSGVFHAKLGLLIGRQRCTLICGSNNLTRSGYTSNLELVNAVTLPYTGRSTMPSLAMDALGFFRESARRAVRGPGSLATEWIEEIIDGFESPTGPPHPDTPDIRLLHTYHASLWDAIQDEIRAENPRSFLVVSPFHDNDNALARSLASLCPRTPIRLVVQQHLTRLDRESVTRLASVSLHAVSVTNRRLHAKLVAWETENGWHCISGSPNFTTAAYLGRNVETALLIRGVDRQILSLFDADLNTAPIPAAEFEPGPQDEIAAGDDIRLLTLKSALLEADNTLSVEFDVAAVQGLSGLRLHLLGPGDETARYSRPIERMSTDSFKIPPDVVADVGGVLTARLVADLEDETVQSDPTWVIQERYLTVETSERSRNRAQSVFETGAGLTEYLDEILKNTGVDGAVEFLRQHYIQFHDGADRSDHRRRFMVRARDPFIPDNVPDWLATLSNGLNDLQAAIYDFVERHKTHRLQKHAKKGNVNGIDNFLDIMRAIVHLLLVYESRGVVPTERLVGYCCDCIELATNGKGKGPGYLSSIASHVGSDPLILRTACDDSEFVAVITAVLRIAQLARRSYDEPLLDGKRKMPLRTYLHSTSAALRICLHDLGLPPANKQQVRDHLRWYGTFDADAISEMVP